MFRNPDVRCAALLLRGFYFCAEFSFSARNLVSLKIKRSGVVSRANSCFTPITRKFFLVFIGLTWVNCCLATSSFTRYYKAGEMAEESPKRRKANFNEAETEMLVEEVLKHEGVLFGTGPNRISPGQKRKIWESIMRKINVVAACPRDVEDLKKRWRDLKRRDRERVSRISWSIQGSSSDPHLVDDFSMKDERFFTSFHSDIVPAVGGIDTLEFASNSSGQGGLMDIAGSSHQSFHQEDMDLKEELDLEIVKQEVSVDEEADGLPSQEPPLSISTSTASVIASLPSRGHKRKGSCKAQPVLNQVDYTEDELLQLQQQQTEAIQAGFDSINQNLGILQRGVYDLGSSLSMVAQTLVEIKNIYVKNNTSICCTEASTQTGLIDHQDCLRCSSADDRRSEPNPSSNSVSQDLSCTIRSQITEDRTKLYNHDKHNFDLPDI